MASQQNHKLNSLTPSELKERLAGRQLFIWGASIVGQGMAKALQRHGIALRAYLDSSSRFQDQGIGGYEVWAPSKLLENSQQRVQAFIIIASGHYEDEISAKCRRAGLSSGKDYISARELSPLDPSVDVAGLCNLKCMSCPRGNMSPQPKPGFITPEVYGRVLDKLLAELPFLGSVQLYTWGEPLLHKELGAIIEMTVQRKLLCAISTNLNVKKGLERVIQAKPDWLKVSASGFGPSYELTHTGGNWEVFLANLYRLKELRDKYHPQMYVELNYHLYRHNLGDDYNNMEKLCRELRIAFRPNWAYLYPLDNVLTYCQGGELSTQAKDTMKLLVMDIDQGLAKASAQKDLPCAEDRCFPITWDLKVKGCGAYFQPVIADNFLETPLQDILAKRLESGICGVCRQHALHRFTSVYLEEASAKEALAVREVAASVDSV